MVSFPSAVNCEPEVRSAMPRIFISHASANNALALAIGHWLADNGWDDYFLDLEPVEGFAPGERWQQALKAAADRCEAVLFLISPAWCDSRSCLAQLSLARFLGKTIFGVLVEPTPPDALPKEMTAQWQLCDLATGTQRQSFRVWHDPLVPQTEVSFAKAGLAKLELGLRRAGLAASSFSWPPANDVERPPYPGLRALEAEDAAVFFGRDTAVVRGLDTLRSVREQGIERMLVILGASGAGKSSFLRAGLWPRLKRDDRNFLPLPVIRPERAVLTGATGLVVSIELAFQELAVPRTRAEIHQAVQTPDGFEQLLGQLQTLHCSRLGSDAVAPTVLVCIDQGDELFGAEGEEESLHFLSVLARTLAAAESGGIQAIGKRQHALAVVAIRTDAYEQLRSAPMLRGISPRVFSLPPFERAEFKAVIEGPAARATAAGRKLTIQPALTERLLQDTEGADALPLLAFTLERLLTDYGAAGNFSVADYEAIGGVRGSIEAAVESAFADPGREPAVPADKAERERLLCEGLIPWLAHVERLTQQRKRRVARWDELPESAHAVLKRLIRYRLLLQDRRKAEAGDEEITIVEIAHEALLRQWPVLTTWLDADADALKTVETVQRAAHEWQKNGQGTAWLAHAGERLTSAEAVLQRSDFERLLGADGLSYLRACRGRDEDARAERESQLQQIAQARTASTQRRMQILMGVIAVILIATGGWIIYQTRTVARQTSAVFASAATTANDAGNYDRAMRFAILAMGKSWLSPGSVDAELELMRGAQASMQIALLSGHRDAVDSAVFSPDGKRMVTASWDGTARVWDAATGKQIVQLSGHQGLVYSAAFDPDGRRVVTASADRTARVWDASTGKQIVQLGGHRDLVYFAAFSPDGRRVATASADRTARVWDAATGKQIAQLNGQQGPVFSAAFSPDGRRVVSASADRTARVWDAATGQAIAQLIGHRELVSSAAFSPDGRRVVSASDDKTARVWDAANGQVITQLTGHQGPVFSAAFSPDGRRVVTASADETARVWDAATGHVITQLTGHQGPVSSAAFTPDGLRVVTASDDKTARVWDAATGQIIAQLIGHEGPVNVAVFSLDGQRVLTASRDGTARAWDAGQGILLLSGHHEPVVSAAFGPDGQRVVTASRDRTTRVWDVATGKQIALLSGHQGAVDSAVFSPDGKRVVTASWDGTARVWDAATGKQLAQLSGHQGTVFSAAFSPDSQRVVTACADGTARLWDATTGKLILILSGHQEPVDSVVYSPDGQRVVTASWDGTARVWDAATGKQILVLSGHHGTVFSAAFSPDGRRVVTAAADGTARVWDAATGKQIARFGGHQGAVSSAAFSPDGQRVVTASADQTARVWDAATGRVIAQLTGHRGPVNSAAFSPDGQRVVTASADQTARVWPIRWLMQNRGRGLAMAVCKKKLVGANLLTTGDAAALSLVRGREGENVCGS
ncbi:nSTAND1 domain-containing NTPase [Paraburkholderia atlantica]|uniref:nSTAND1 domain-containing NTPase n=1 Tax=Paraburkholderia atlantica TaxID=2654982 RepID=UPI000378F1E9|nr:TIR domain-containing protein [Paraburkholderia atlantica]